MVRIKSNHTILPSEPTPKGRLWLSKCDQLIHPRTYTPTIYIYKPQHRNHTTSCSVIERMRDSLSKTLVHYYPLAGRLRCIGRKQYEVDCNEMGVTLLEAESDKILDEYDDFAPDSSIRELIPKIDFGEPIEKLPFLFVQVTRFSCGSFSVGFASSHMVMDGVSATDFVKSWAKLARGYKLNKEETPSLDRMALQSQELRMVQAPRFRHREFEPLPLILSQSDNTEERNKETSIELLKFTKEEVEKLKIKVNQATKVQEIVGQHGRPYSKFEALSAHIWRCVTKARRPDNLQPTVVWTVGDIRNRLNPPLPGNYFGNAVFPTVTPECLSGDIISKTLSYAAEKVRESIETLTDEYIRSQFDFLTSDQLHKFGSVQDHFLGNPNLTIGCWTGIPIFEADFGWGKPIYVGLGALDGDGSTFIIPTSAGDGSLIVAICLQKTHMKAFKMLFYEDLEN
ncbi:hypothetical protein L6164_000055 [Bauhinia variegata]|uniref:Uncharacterized protein n=1 Tax=Bauhinia variegata TaxID=167791 RepID=A0ACB9Q5F1_BAUVA|nr:hypothetical protein L6164_000055 [Bauhinia variegata]